MGVSVTPFTLFQDSGVERRVRSLKFDLNAMADFEQATGMGLAQLMSSNAVFAATRALLWAGLRHADRGLTLDSAGTLIQKYLQTSDDAEIKLVLEACLEACYQQKAIPRLKKTSEVEDEGADQDPNEQSSSQPTGTQTSPGPVTSGGSSSTPTTSLDSVLVNSDS